MRNRKLGRLLTAARLMRGMSLRDVERTSKQKISNGYLSLVERGLDYEPSPHKLRAIARALQLDYLVVMKAAGYLTSRDLRGGK